jgi:flagellar basal-body rod protein FlgG
MRKLEIVNNNLANVNTPGFKKEVLSGDEQTFDETFASALGGKDPYAKGDHERTPGTTNIKAVTDFSQGPIKNTANPFDLALKNPKDFFVINTPTGPQYTRAGDFTLNTNGDLVTQDGFQVQGDGGAITINTPGAAITAGGRVQANGEDIGTIQVARFDKPEALQRVGFNRFTVPAGQQGPTQIDNPEIIPQALEMSNVSAVSSVIDLITASRAFDLYTRSAQTIDSLNQTAIGQVGRGR